MTYRDCRITPYVRKGERGRKYLNVALDQLACLMCVILDHATWVPCDLATKKVVYAHLNFMMSPPVISS